MVSICVTAEHVEHLQSNALVPCLSETFFCTLLRLCNHDKWGRGSLVRNSKLTAVAIVLLATETVDGPPVRTPVTPGELSRLIRFWSVALFQHSPLLFACLLECNTTFSFAF